MIALIDYDAGNTCSVMNALNRLNAGYKLSDDIEFIRSADKVIFPGVGHAGAAMEALRRKGLVGLIQTLQQPVLGICVGMQLLASHSEEGDTPCLSILPGTIRKFEHSLDIKVPHMGWNNLRLESEDGLFKDLKDDSHFYFVHSYYLPSSTYTIASCDYGGSFTAAVRKDNFRGIQFHAEKSGANGARLLSNFLNDDL